MAAEVGQRSKSGLEISCPREGKDGEPGSTGEDGWIDERVVGEWMRSIFWHLFYVSVEKKFISFLLCNPITVLGRRQSQGI